MGLTVAPVMPYGEEAEWQQGYGALLADAAAALAEVPEPDLTVEVLSWYPRTQLEMDETLRTVKRSKFGGLTYVYPRDRMAALGHWFDAALAEHLPSARLLYWT